MRCVIVLSILMSVATALPVQSRRRLLPQDGECKNTASNPCSQTGASGAYSETIEGSQRQITTSGCPNNNPLTICVGDNPNPANTQTWNLAIPATPKLNAASYEASLGLGRIVAL